MSFAIFFMISFSRKKESMTKYSRSKMFSTRITKGFLFSLEQFASFVSLVDLSHELSPQNIPGIGYLDFLERSFYYVYLRQ